MADSFADLWNSSAPIKPTPPPQKLGSVINNTSLQPRKSGQQDVFAMLSSAGSSAPGSRPITPASITNSIPKPPPTSTSTSSGDAFSNLLTGTLASSSRANLTIAQRAALVEKERTDKYLKGREEARREALAWDGIDSLGLGSTRSGAVQGPVVAGVNGSSSSGSSGDKAVDDDDWGLNDFVSPPTTKATQPQAESLWDLDEFASPSQSQNVNDAPPSQAYKSATADFDFDFGDHEDSLLPTEEDDDILGVLSNPVHSIPKRPSPTTSSSSPSPSPPSQTQTQTRPPPSRHTNGTPRRPTPPPHILGQLVEMGFSIQQAKDALGATQSGVDVQGALEVLLSAGSASGSGAGMRESDRLDGGDRIDDVLPNRRQRPPHRPSPSSSTSLTTPQNPSIKPTQPQPPPTAQTQTQTQLQIQEQADKLLAQASEIGLSVLSRANAFWKEGKERARGIYEERGGGVGGASGSGRGRGGDGKPRWMQDGDNRGDGRDDEWGSKENGREGAFVDGFDGRDAAPKRSRPSDTRSSRPKPESEAQAVGDLFGDAPPATTAYVSPYRRGNLPTKPSPTPTPTPTPPKKTHPPQILASPTALTTAKTHKQTGTSYYKLGQFTAAHTSYTSAISSLPAKHLLLVPLYNNRALVRLKIGDVGGAVEDCSAVVGIVGDWGDLGDLGVEGGRRVRVGVEGEGEGGEGEVVDLGEGFVKALKRRAEAWEGKEKWEEAGKDWEVLGALKWVTGNVRGEAVRGAGRCRRMMMAGSTIEETNPKPKSKPKPKPPTTTHPPNPTPSQALKTHPTQPPSDAHLLALKDTTDTRLLAWKTGKETNIRALLASLETVLWPELGWRKVGMGEVVSDGQVKVGYLRAIGKVHPDKLNVNNTTLEQRMIANGVFGTLNEAWNAFRQ